METLDEKSKRPGDMAQMVEHFCSMCKTIGSITSARKKIHLTKRIVSTI
jgi:hypothetical protein